ncbi:hypothetical protein AXF42_Ash021773 [Apostasia shenzhenica]|uniref:Uncharacterized protein n=1 Tax=Apostasia shenzhenica TaxID=1088818 RepID=A0A2H9ZX11_9ASPA|nr:hypothetical protein AXF42_Ash021773 [Apostasia shenzhenica]
MEEVVGLSLVFDVAGDLRDRSLVKRSERGCKGQTSGEEDRRRPNVVCKRLQKAKHRVRSLR